MQDTKFELHRDYLARPEHGELVQVVVELMPAAKSERAWGRLLVPITSLCVTVILTSSRDVWGNGLEGGRYIPFGNVEGSLPTEPSHRRP